MSRDSRALLALALAFRVALLALLLPGQGGAGPGSLQPAERVVAQVQTALLAPDRAALAARPETHLPKLAGLPGGAAALLQRPEAGCSTLCLAAVAVFAPPPAATLPEPRAPPHRLA